MKKQQVIPCDPSIGKVNKTNPTFKNLSRVHHVFVVYNSTNSCGDDMLKGHTGHVDSVTDTTITLRDNKANTHNVDWSDVEYYIIKHTVGS